MQAILLFALFIRFFFSFLLSIFFWIPHTMAMILILSDLVSGEESVWSVTDFWKIIEESLKFWFFKKSCKNTRIDQKKSDDSNGRSHQKRI
jgi:hypothetical protein